MSKIFSGQSALRITVKTFTDLEGVLAAGIKYRKPDGLRGEFVAGIADAARGVIFHECIEGEIDHCQQLKVSFLQQFDLWLW
jgi:hypothetical protein